MTAQRHIPFTVQLLYVEILLGTLLSYDGKKCHLPTYHQDNKPLG